MGRYRTDIPQELVLPNLLDFPYHPLTSTPYPSPAPPSSSLTISMNHLAIAVRGHYSVIIACAMCTHYIFIRFFDSFFATVEHVGRACLRARTGNVLSTCHLFVRPFTLFFDRTLFARFPSDLDAQRVYTYRR